MDRNIVILSGSPRKGANTDKLVAAFVEGAQSAGHNVTCFRVADMKIGGCLGCGHCFEETGVCAQKDDMVNILNAMRKSDVLVWASPVYYSDVSAQLKLAIDRTYALLKERKLPIRKVALLMTCGAGSDEVADTAISLFNKVCAPWEKAGIIVATGLHGPDDINGHPELDQARKLGQEI